MFFGEYPVNDDWVFLRQVEAFNNNIFTINAELDPSFISQGFLGMVWVKIFGYSITNLQVLTFIITLLAILTFAKILSSLKVKKSLILISSILLFFNPIVFINSFTFMTENYYLFFMIISVFFYIRYLQQDKLIFVVFGSIFGLLALLTREIGLLIGFSFILSLLAKKLISKNISTNDLKSVFIVSLYIIIGMLTVYFWPKFGGNRVFILAEQVPFRLKTMMLSIHYFPLFIFPLLFGLNTRLIGKDRIKTLFSIICIILFTWYLYVYSIFPVGNTFYIEALYTKSNFRSNFSLFDNIYFKLFLSFLLAISFTKFLLALKKFNTNFKKPDTIDLFLVFGFISNFAIIFIASDFYERYLIPSFVMFFIYFIKNMQNQIKITGSVKYSLILLIVISVFLQWDFYSKNKTSWDIARKISNERDITSSISFKGTYINYAVTKKENDYTGLIERRQSSDTSCYVQDYTIDDPNFLAPLEKLEEFIIDNTFIQKHKPYLSNKKDGIPRAKNNLDKMLYNEQYYTPLYTLIGKRAYVGGWCVD